MSEQSPSQPKMTSRTAASKEARTDRLALEMRKNLMKRKRQQREKTADAEDGLANDAGSQPSGSTPKRSPS